MRLGVVSDIHGNLEALESVLAALDQRDVDRIVCLGDIVGYNANPKECLAIVRERCPVAIRGNHERMVLGGALKGLRKETRNATSWTRSQLTQEETAYLASLPDEAVVDDAAALLVHGSPRDPDEYILSDDVIHASLDLLARDYPDARICFFGHSHFPMVLGPPDVHVRLRETQTVRLLPDRRYLVNPGSVGQPRDSCPLASCAVYDTDEKTIELLRLEYDLEKTQRKIREAGLADRLALRLALGR